MYIYSIQYKSGKEDGYRHRKYKLTRGKQKPELVKNHMRKIKRMIKDLVGKKERKEGLSTEKTSEF